MTEFIKLELAISRKGLKINGKEYKANIQFDNNEIKVCDETKENAVWFNEFLDDATSFKRNSIEYQEKKYEVLAETLLTIIIYHLKKEICIVERPPATYHQCTLRSCNRHCFAQICRWKCRG